MLNPALVTRAPRACVDYVICHELCHLREHKSIASSITVCCLLAMPDWQARKQELDDIAEQVLNR